MNAPPSTPVVNATSSQLNQSSSTCLFDTRSSYHVTSDRSTLHYVLEYGCPDEIILGDGKGLSISYIRHISLSTSSCYLSLSLTHTLSPSLSLSLLDVFCVAHLLKILILIAILWKSNNFSVEFFPIHFFVEDLCMGALLMQGENDGDIYHASLKTLP